MNSEDPVLNLGDTTLWVPYKSLYNVINNSITQKHLSAVQDLDIALKRHKPDLLCLLRNPPRTASHREAVRKSSVTGIAITGRTGLQILPQPLVDEALLISDMFDLNELASLELLIAGQQQQPRFPGLTRGLVAMLLYYDGRRNLVNALQLLIQAREGRTWTIGVNPELQSVIMKYTNELKEEGIIMKIIDLIEKTDVSEELELLQRNRALGGPKYRRQVTDLIAEVKQTLAEILFSWSCQSSFSKDEIMRLIGYLSKHTGISANGSLDDATLTVAMSFLYAIDTSMLQTSDEKDAVIQDLNLVCVPDLCPLIHRALVVSEDKWQMPGLKSIFQFAWSVSLRTMSQFPISIFSESVRDILEEDERTMDISIENNAFQAMKFLIVNSPIFHQQEFFLKGMHGIVSDFIVLMPIKVKELRNRGDEAARIIASHSQEGLEPPANLTLYFNNLMSLISDLYSKDPLNLELSSEYWCSSENVLEQSYLQRPSQKQIALYKFVRLAGDLLPPQLFVPYHNMLTSLANSSRCAHNCFSMLKMNGRNGSQSSIVSWDHFFATLHRYYASLHERVPHTLDKQHAYPQRMHIKGITSQEIQGLVSVLQLIGQIVKLDEIARITLNENSQYAPISVIMGLIECSIPAQLKAVLIDCLAAFATSSDTALTIWQKLENSQIIPTVKSTSVYHPSGILMELEEMETRNEEYPVTRAMVGLLDTLLNHAYPTNLGSATRQPGIEPYLLFIRDTVLLRCTSRSYKIEGEKWKIMALCIKVLEKVLKNCNFQSNHSAAGSNAGITVLVHMLHDTGLLRTVLFILDEGACILDQFATVAGQSDLEDCTLLALKLIHTTLTKQEGFLHQIRESGCDLLVTPLENLLLSINARSGQADHLLVITKYVTYNASIPKHSLYAIGILHDLCSSIQLAQNLVKVYDSDSQQSENILKGFIEVFEVDVPEYEIKRDAGIETGTTSREQLLQLLLKCLRQPGPNLAHYLLGFNIRKPISQTEFQEPGVMGARRTCLHAILSFLDSESQNSDNAFNANYSAHATELAYKLIYVLGTNSDTSGPTLRYLRSTHDFLFRHMQSLPFKLKGDSNDVHLLCQQSWLMRALAVELRVTSVHQQRSHVYRLLCSLLDDKLSVENELGDASLEPSFAKSSLSVYSIMKPTAGIYRRKLLQLLDTVHFQHVFPSSPIWNFFENEEVDCVLKNCEVAKTDCPMHINIEKLHTKLLEVTYGLQAATALGQKPALVQEISQIVEYAVSINKAREAIYAERLLFDAWRQVTEVLLIACPLEMLGAEKRDQMILEVSQDLLTKIMKQDVLSELMSPASGILLTLMSKLRQSMLEPFIKPIFQTSFQSHPGSLSMESMMIPLSHHSSLHAVLRSVVECLLKTGSGLQRVRANFYTAFLNLLCIVQKPFDIQDFVPQGTTSVLDQHHTEKKLRSEYMEIILGFGESLVEIVCRDACAGHDITKMLALAVLDIAISLDTQQQWLTYLVSKGYLRHILDSLAKDDEELQNLFTQTSNSNKIFYVFESKMAYLTRISCTTNGALALLQNGAIHRLAECRALDLRPDLRNMMKQDSSMWVSPDFLKYYRQMFMAIMKLVLSISMTLGSDHREASLQLLEFVVCNAELFSHAIRDSSNLDTVEGLEELIVISAVLSRASFDDPSTLTSDNFLSEQRGHLLLLRQHMLMLIPRLLSTEHTTTNYGIASDDLEARVKMCRLQIMTHILGSCCSVINKTGKESQNWPILFGPCVSNSASANAFILSSNLQKKLPMTIGRSPDLSFLIAILSQSVSGSHSSTNDQKVLSHRLQSLSKLTSDELAEHLPPNFKEGHPSLQYQREYVGSSLQKIIKHKAKETSLHMYLIETSAFILLRHLEYYFVNCSKENSSFSFADKSQMNMRRLQDSSPLSPVNRNVNEAQSRSLLSSVDFKSFKAEISTSLGEPFFRKLNSIIQQNDENTNRPLVFLKAISNRLKRLVQIKI